MLIAHSTLGLLLSKMIITRKERKFFHILRWGETTWRLWRRRSSLLPDKTSLFKKIFSSNTLVRQNTIAMNTNSTVAGSYTENTSWYGQFDLRQIRILRGCQPIIDFDAADKYRLYVTTVKAMKFQVDIPSIPNDNF